MKFYIPVQVPGRKRFWLRGDLMNGPTCSYRKLCAPFRKNPPKY